GIRRPDTHVSVPPPDRRLRPVESSRPLEDDGHVAPDPFGCPVVRRQTEQEIRHRLDPMKDELVSALGENEELPFLQGDQTGGPSVVRPPAGGGGRRPCAPQDTPPGRRYLVPGFRVRAQGIAQEIRGRGRVPVAERDLPGTRRDPEVEDMSGDTAERRAVAAA